MTLQRPWIPENAGVQGFWESGKGENWMLLHDCPLYYGDHHQSPLKNAIKISMHLYQLEEHGLGETFG